MFFNTYNFTLRLQIDTRATLFLLAAIGIGLHSEFVLKVSRAVRVQMARSTETYVYWTYLRIWGAAQRSNRAAKQLFKHVLMR